jgi:heat-inducible transcriptional repressor
VDIGARAKKILHAVVSEYLATGEAVGSQTVTRRYGLDVSAATVRNVMGDLEEVGLLKHLHTSAGRIPTERGLRYYVDTLLRVRSLSTGEKDDIRERLAGAPGDVPEVMQRTSRLLRELSHLTVVVQAPRPESDAVAHLEFVRLRDTHLLAVLETASRQVQNKLVPVDFPIAPGDLDRINNYLNELASGLTLDQLRGRLMEEIASDRAAHDQLVARALQLASAAVPAGAQAEVLVDGQSNLLAGKADLERAKVLLRTLEEKDLLVRLLDRTLGAPGICVFIGAEANLADLTDVSVVAAPYGPEGRPLGTIGVIGPARMNYSRVIPLVDFTAEMIGETLTKP